MIGHHTKIILIFDVTYFTKKINSYFELADALP